ncbi:MAG: class II fructose-bisphosphatase [Phycisphaerales bacterium]|nr:class II fructose-bisphosphatase [Phycisphaerales bacterium]
MSQKDARAETRLYQHEVEAEKVIGMDLVRACEAAALNVWRWIGKGDKEAADAAATDAIRGMLNLMDICGTCTIGEGIKDEAPGIFVGEKLGSWKTGSAAVSIAVDPIDGTTLTSKGLPGALSVIAAAQTRSVEERALLAVPSVYMEKIAVGPKVKEGTGTIRLGASVEQNLELIALKLGKRVRDLVVCILDRPRHELLISDVRRTGAAIRLIGDGDVAGAIAPSMPDSGVDVYMGIGGSPEAVLAAAAIKCLGGEIQARMWPRDDKEREALKADGYDAAKIAHVYTTEDMAQGDHIVFAATGITDNAMMRGVRVDGRVAVTESIVMRSSSRTVRYIKASHDLTRKTIRVGSDPHERSV